MYFGNTNVCFSIHIMSCLIIQLYATLTTVKPKPEHGESYNTLHMNIIVYLLLTSRIKSIILANTTYANTHWYKIFNGDNASYDE